MSSDPVNLVSDRDLRSALISREAAARRARNERKQADMDFLRENIEIFLGMVPHHGTPHCSDEKPIHKNSPDDGRIPCRRCVLLGIKGNYYNDNIVPVIDLKIVSMEECDISRMSINIT